MTNLCLTLLCPRDIEEELLDLLLMSPGVAIFTSMLTAVHAAVHGSIVESLSQNEQVLGRALATQIQVIFAETDKTVLLENIRQQFAGSGLHYWLTMVLETGEIQ